MVLSSSRRNQKSNTATRNPWIIAFASKTQPLLTECHLPPKTQNRADAQANKNMFFWWWHRTACRVVARSSSCSCPIWLVWFEMTAMAFQCSHRMGLDSFQEPSACDLGKMQIGTVYVLKKGKREMTLNGCLFPVLAAFNLNCVWSMGLKQQPFFLTAHELSCC